MADDVKEGSGNVDASMAGLLDKIASKLSPSDYGEVEVAKEEVKDDSVEETTEKPKEEAVAGDKVEEPQEKEPTEEKRDKVQERIDKLTAQRKSAEEEAASLKAKVEELSKGPTKEYVPVPTKEDPLSDVLDFDSLKAREATVEQLREHCLMNPDGFSYVSDGKEEFVNAQQVRKTLVDTDKLLRKDIPARTQWLKDYDQVTIQAKQDYPELFDARTSEYQLAKRIEQMLPEIKRIPAYKEFIGHAIYGEKMKMAERAKKSTPAKAAADSKQLPSTPTTSAGTTSTKSGPKPPAKPPIRGSKSDAVNHIMDTVLKNINY